MYQKPKYTYSSDNTQIFFTQLQERLNTIWNQSRQNPSQIQNLTTIPNQRKNRPYSPVNLSPQPVLRSKQTATGIKLGPGYYQHPPQPSPIGGCLDLTPRFKQDIIDSLKKRVRHKRNLSQQQKLNIYKIMKRNKNFNQYKTWNQIMTIRFNSIRRDLLHANHKQVRLAISKEKAIKVRKKYEDKLARIHYRNKMQQINKISQDWFQLNTIFGMVYVLSQRLKMKQVKLIQILKQRSAFNIKVLKQIIRALGKLKRRVWQIRFNRLKEVMQKASPNMKNWLVWIVQKRKKLVTQAIEDSCFRAGLFGFMAQFLRRVKDMKVVKIQRQIKSFLVVSKTRKEALKIQWRNMEYESHILQTKLMKIRKMKNIMVSEYNELENNGITRFLHRRLKEYVKLEQEFRMKLEQLKTKNRSTLPRKHLEQLIRRKRFETKREEVSKKPILLIFSKKQEIKKLIFRIYSSFQKLVQKSKQRKIERVIHSVQERPSMNIEEILKIAFGPLLKHILFLKSN